MQSSTSSPSPSLPTNIVMGIQEDLEARRLKIIEGINTLLALFEGASQPLFPRKVMTAVSNGQIAVNSIEEMLQRFEAAQFVDCRISAYPKLPKDALHVPNIILIDLDVNWSLKTGQASTKKSLNKILTNIEEYCSSYSDDEITVPLVLWTGNGYHVYLVLNMPEPLEYIQEYKSLGIEQISREFMLFAKAFLSENKADTKNNPSFESCLLRVPYSLNSKCLSKGVNGATAAAAGVKVIQNWNGNTATVNEIPLMLSGFYTHLISKKMLQYKRLVP